MIFLFFIFSPKSSKAEIDFPIITIVVWFLLDGSSHTALKVVCVCYQVPVHCQWLHDLLSHEYIRRFQLRVVV